jgi:hypothetical protein
VQSEHLRHRLGQEQASPCKVTGSEVCEELRSRPWESEILGERLYVPYQLGGWPTSVFSSPDVHWDLQEVAGSCGARCDSGPTVGGWHPSQQSVLTWGS